jgi:hypothetical protein
MARLIEYAAPAARAACRSVSNDPVLAVYVDSRLEEWVLGWTPADNPGESLRAFIARRAANEARRYMAMDADERRKLRWQYRPEPLT